MQLVPGNLLAALPVPDDDVRPEAHVVGLAGSDHLPRRRYVHRRDGVGVAAQKRLPVRFQLVDRDFVSEREDQVLLVRVDAQTGDDVTLKDLGVNELSFN